MNFLLSEDQIALQSAVRDFALERCDAGVRRSAFESEAGFNPTFWGGLMSLGVGGIALPESSGGLGLGVLDLALAAEALGYTGAPGPFLGHVIAAHAIHLCGTAEQKSRWLPRLSLGDITATVALAEPSNRVQSAGWQTRIDKGKLTGRKWDVLYPEIADLIVIGVSDGFALLERGTAEMSFEVRDVADRTRRLSHVTFETCTAEPMPADRAQQDRVVDAALVLLAADAFGGATRMLELSVEYAKAREQFGGPIGRFQGLKHQLANMAVDVEPARGLYWYAAHAYDQAAVDGRRMAALAKAHLADVFMQTARAGIEAHGGIGYTWDYDAQIWFKRAMFDFAYLGTPSHHRERAAQLAGW